MSTNFIYANLFNVVLQSPITSSGQTNITINSTTNAPTITAGQIWVIALNDAATQTVYEICYATARTGNVLTVLRGQEGTAATTWLAGDNVYAPDTAAILNNFALINGSTSNNFAVAALTASDLTVTSTSTTAVTAQINGVTSQTSFLFAVSPTAGANPVLYVNSTNYTLATNFCASALTNYSNNGQTAGDIAAQRSVSTGALFLGGAMATYELNFGLTLAGSATYNVPSSGTHQFAVNGTVMAAVNGNGVLDLGASGTQSSGFLGIASTVGFTGLGVDSALAVNTVDATVIGVFAAPNNAATLYATIDGGGNLGILGTLHQTSRREMKQRIEYIDPAEALQIVLSTKIARYDFIGEDPLDNGQTHHASFIADETPWELSGGPGYEHADPQKTASYALAAIAGLAARVIALEAKG